jgi:hypothetical protein
VGARRVELDLNKHVLAPMGSVLWAAAMADVITADKTLP